MGHFHAVQPKQKTRLLQDPWPQALHDDPRWELIQRVVAGSHFAHSPLLSKFLQFVVAETLEGRGNEITERQIGVHVFDRPPNYRTEEDNIVRNYARQIRKRLAEHFAGDGVSETLRVDIPVGGYVPVFTTAGSENPADVHSQLPVTVRIHAESANVLATPDGGLDPASRPLLRPPWVRPLLLAVLAVVYSGAVFGLAWFAARQTEAPPPPPEPAHVLWVALFGGQANSYIVPSDAGFNLLEDVSQRPTPLAEYIQGSYLQTPLPGIDPHSAADLRSQQLTPFVDFQIMASIAQLREETPRRVVIRFPRDLRLDDLKNSNAIIIGSVGSNPWAAIAESSTNFHIVDSPGMQSASIINLKPQPGESASYESHWNEPAHETFALIAFLPNLTGTGHVLILEGLDAAGTQAAAEMLFFQSAIDPILKRATRPDGSLRNFEVLLRSTSIQSNAAGSQVVASRIY
jgi:hypothetical protein